MFQSTPSRIMTIVVMASALAMGSATSASAADDHPEVIRSGDGDTLRAIFYEHANFTGEELHYYGGSACSKSTKDSDFSKSVVPLGWNDIVSSVKDFHGCDVTLYTDGGFKGKNSGYINFGVNGKNVPRGFNDKMSSFRVS